MTKKLKEINVLHFGEREEKDARIQQASVLIQFEGGNPLLIQGTQTLKGDVNGKHTINYNIFDGKNSGSATYSIETLGKEQTKTKLHIVGISEGGVCCGSNKPVDSTIDVQTKTFSSNDPSIQCDICEAILKGICEDIADGIPSDEICADICVEGAGDICLIFVETIIGYLICLSICASLCASAIEIIEDYGCGVGAGFLCEKLNIC